jgi:hypothetical protein
MSTKRGRPLSATTDDAVLARRRQQTAERTRLWRLRQRRVAAAITMTTQEQVQQGETIIEGSFTHHDAAVTPTQLGLRVEHVTLAQNVEDARLQEQAVPVDEHDALYHISTPDVTEPTQPPPPPPLLPSPSPPSSRASSPPPSPSHPSFPHSSQARTARFFSSLGGFSDPEDHVEGPRRRTSSPSTSEPETETEAENRGRYLDDRQRRTEEELREDKEDQAIGDAESSCYGFESEQSHHSSEAERDPNLIRAESPARDYAVEKLYDQLQGGFHGCTSEQHEEALRQHLHTAGDNHHDLNELFNDATFPSVLSLPRFITADQLSRQQPPTPAQWKAFFCGTRPGPRSRRPMQVCLHKAETQEVELDTAFDIDSFLGFTSSPAVARQGLWYQPAPRTLQNLKTDVHIETEAFYESADTDQAPRSSLTMLKDVPHFALGRVEGAHDITIYILFPRLMPARGEFKAMSNDQLSRWLDRVFHPALYRHYDAHYTQHLPASYQHALANAKAAQVEGRMVDGANYQAQLSLGYHLQPERLHLIWEDILHTITHTPGLHDFRDLQLFFNAKGTKLQFKTNPFRPTLLDTMNNFQTYFERIMDLDCIFWDRFYVDVGKEICPQVSLLTHERAHFDDEAQVYLWKRCCLERYLQWMYDQHPPKSGHRFYHQTMLRDACNLTSLTPKRSRLRKGGLVYSQFYSSVKEIVDAAKSFPFQNDGMEELALDPLIRQGARHAGGGRARQVKIVEQAYCASKHRTQYALLASQKKSFGVREEHRISWPLFQALQQRLELEPSETLEIVLIDCPAYVWAVKTDVFLNFVWRNVDKFATGFEIVLARCHQEFVTWEQTKMMAMFLRCLRFSMTSHQFSPESTLWWSKRERVRAEGPAEVVQTWYGLGFCNTLERYGYCWLEPRFDWERLTFQSSITDNVLFGNRTLRQQYLRRGGQVRDFLDSNRQLDIALDWLQEHRQHERIRERLLLWIVHLCLRQFRIDVVTAVRQEVHPDRSDDAFQGYDPFCVEYFEDLMDDDVHLVSGNKSEFKDPSRLGRVLFEFNDGRIRTHWDNKPYRKLYQRASMALALHHSTAGLANQMKHILQRHLFIYHWILPYPSTEVFTQTTKAGDRMWYSVRPRTEAMGRFEELRSTQWEWARKNWQSGHPPALPRWIRWSKTEWQEWIDRNRNEAGNRNVRNDVIRAFQLSSSS